MAKRKQARKKNTLLTWGHRFTQSKKHRLIQQAMRSEYRKGDRRYGIQPHIIWGDEYDFRKKHGLPAEDIPYKDFKKHLKWGNQKLGKNIGIFNIGTGIECPSRRQGFCKIPEGKCYAIGAELQYSSPYLYRKRQKRIWDVIAPEQFTSHTAESYERKKKRPKNPFMRFDEAGEFYTQQDVDKLGVISEGLGKRGIRTYTYTARQDLDYRNTPKALVINRSGWDEGDVNKHMNRFTALEKPTSRFICPGTASKKCGQAFIIDEKGKRVPGCMHCMFGTGKNIEIGLH